MNRYFDSRPPHGGRHPFRYAESICTVHFNSRPPHGGRRSEALSKRTDRDFNSRPPHGGRRRGAKVRHLMQHNFNSRPPHGGRRTQIQIQGTGTSTSTHDLHTEVDLAWAAASVLAGELQLTTSTRRSTPRRITSKQYRRTSTHDLHTEVDTIGHAARKRRETSTHDLHTEVDDALQSHRLCSGYFNSRPPHGGRPSNSRE